MRELKFRAWDQRDIENPPSMYYFNLSEGNMYKRSGYIMQYTGLKDKNGKEIYEGDILSKKWICEVYKDKNTGTYMVKFHKNPSVNKPISLYKYIKGRTRAGTYEDDIEIIGNICENPELL